MAGSWFQPSETINMVGKRRGRDLPISGSKA
jgi:hypothetical protein